MSLEDPSPSALKRSRRGHGRLTLDHVAQRAEVTKITVSRFLREPAKVAPATAERIRQALAETGYVPNKQAGLLASGRSNIVAALIPNLSHSIFGDTVQALSEGLQAAGLELLLASTSYSQEREEDQLRTVLGWAPAAIVLTGRRHSQGTHTLLAQAHDSGTPVIEVWDHHPEEEGAYVQIGFDHGAVGQAMAEHLLDAGHRHIAYLDSAVAQDFRAHERGAGLIGAAQRAGAQTTVLRAAPGDPFEAGRLALAALLNSPPKRPPKDLLKGPLRAQKAANPSRATAVACANDQLACGLMMAAQAQGLAVPQGLAVLGFGDFPLSRHLVPALSTVRPPSQEIGRAAAQALVACLNEGAPLTGLALPWQLLARASTGA